MRTVDDPITDELLGRAAQGDAQAVERLLGRYRQRLRQMVAVRMDPRLSPRLDPSDVVQETFVRAIERLSEYLEQRPMPFYLWLRQLAWQRLVDLSRRHIGAGRRSIRHEDDYSLPLADESAMCLAGRLQASGTSPSGRVEREDLRRRVHAALEQLEPDDRELLVLRHLAQLSTREIAVFLGLTEPVVRYRQRRALQRLGELLSRPPSKEQAP
jgi:RNA polymerase sigma-70 factor (ECF subfamily)